MQEILKTNLLSIEKSRPGRRGVRVGTPQQTAAQYLPEKYLRKTAPKLPELSEFDTVRHFTALSEKNYCLDAQFYPLGSCTMKYNPKAYDSLTQLESFTQVHPLAPESAVQNAVCTASSADPSTHRLACFSAKIADTAAAYAAALSSATGYAKTVPAPF